MKRFPPQRPWWFWALIMGVLFLLTLAIAPSQPSTARLQGSTYGRSPADYGAWYAWMGEQGVTIERWRQPLANLTAQTQREEEPPGTLLQIVPQALEPEAGLGPDEEAWIQAGHTLVRLGYRGPVGRPPFTRLIPSPWGEIKIETRRRRPRPQGGETPILQDGDGLLVWQSTQGQGQIITAIPPFLAANAYQDFPGNFALLADLVQRQGGRIWVDEYLHGYRDSTVLAQGGLKTWGDYLAQTPWVLILLQGGMLVLLALYGQNQRFGPPHQLRRPLENNTRAYITALGAVLRRARSHGFVVEVLGKAERHRLQRQLGLGTAPLSQAQVEQAWTRQTGTSPQGIAPLFQGVDRRRPWRESDLQIWLDQLRRIPLPPPFPPSPPPP